MINTVEHAPEIVKLCLRHAHEWFRLHNLDVAIGGLHCNFYNSGKAWVDWHYDEVNPKHPYILSYSFYDDRVDAVRQFRIAYKTPNQKIIRILAYWNSPYGQW